jgi:hypothetical protein
MGMMQLLRGDIGGGTESALAAVDVPQDGYITGIDWSAYGDFDANDEFMLVQLSFSSAFNVGNDSRSSVSVISAQFTLTTSGVAFTGINKFVGPVKIAVNAGERIYLHANSSVGLVGVVHCTVYYDFDISRNSQRRA